MGEESGKFILGIIAVVLLFMLAFKLIGIMRQNTAYEQAKYTMEEINKILNSLQDKETKTLFIESPKNWYLINFNREYNENLPKSCSDKNCLCLCPNSEKDECDKRGVCKTFGDKDIFFLGTDQNCYIKGIPIIGTTKVVNGCIQFITLPIGFRFFSDVDGYFLRKQGEDSEEIKLNSGKGSIVLSEQGIGGITTDILGILNPVTGTNLDRNNIYEGDTNIYSFYVKEKNYITLNQLDPTNNYMSSMPVGAIYSDGSIWISTKIRARIFDEKSLIIEYERYKLEKEGYVPLESYWSSEIKNEENIIYIKYKRQDIKTGNTIEYARPIYKTTESIDFDEFKRTLTDETK